MKRPVIAAMSLFALGTCPLFGQLGAQAVPDLSGFAEAIAKTVSTADAAPVPASPKTPGAGAAPAATATNAKAATFRSGLEVPTVTPGEAAKEIARSIRANIEKQAGPQPSLAQLESGMPQVLAQVEGALETVGFSKRDMGVAVAYLFLYTWETANKQKVPEETSKIAARTFAGATAKHWGPKFSALTPAQKEKFYETLLVSTTLVAAFTDQFEKAGKLEEATAMRKTACELFEKLIGVPPAQVKIEANGAITGLAGK